MKRNRQRFPEDFVFQLTVAEKAEVVAKCDHLGKLKFSKSLPFAFTEHGALMAARVLNSPQAIDASVLITRTFVQLRRILATAADVNQRLTVVENQLTAHNTKIESIMEILRQLISPTMQAKRRIGFGPKEE